MQEKVIFWYNFRLSQRSSLTSFQIWNRIS